MLWEGGEWGRGEKRGCLGLTGGDGGLSPRGRVEEGEFSGMER